MNDPRPERDVVGIAPWLPWPLCAWPWWTEPVRAERLAMLRIGTALFLLIDIILHFAPFTLDYYGKDDLGAPAVFSWRFQPPRTTWSLLLGFDDPANTYFSLIIFLLSTGWILGTTIARILLVHRNPPEQDRTGIALALWTAALTWYIGGSWARMIQAKQPENLAWILPLLGGGLAMLFLGLAFLLGWRDPRERVPYRSLSLSAMFFFALCGVGAKLASMKSYDPQAWWMPIFHSWQNEDSFVIGAMNLWIVCVVMLLFGFFTRTAAVLTWMLGMTFDNTNPYILNAGDTIRIILLMFLMLCPCGAAWSIDAWRAKRAGPVYVHPWPIRLLFVQLMIIYLMNGLYKFWGTTWSDGTSLHYVLGDLALSRFSATWLDLPPWLTRLMTWTVLIWELTFCWLVLWRPTRILALLFGVMFHLGIFMTMELGIFVPYALCLYLPLVPWERWAGKLEGQGTV